MPSVRKLAPEEARTYENRGKTKRQLVEEQYDAFLADFYTGEYGEAEPQEGESKQLVRKRLNEAAERRGVRLTFHRTAGQLLRFEVTETDYDEEDGFRLIPAFGERRAEPLAELEDIPF